MKHAKDKNNSDDSFGLRDTLVWCGIPIIIVLLIRIFLLGFYVIPSGSMMNTIEPGDRVITSKLTPKVFDLKRGDVVVFKDPDHWLQQEDSSKLGGDYLIKHSSDCRETPWHAKGRASRSPSMVWRLTKAHTFARTWTPAHSRST